MLFLRRPGTDRAINLFYLLFKASDLVMKMGRPFKRLLSSENYFPNYLITCFNRLYQEYQGCSCGCCCSVSTKSQDLILAVQQITLGHSRKQRKNFEINTPKISHDFFFVDVIAVCYCSELVNCTRSYFQTVKFGLHLDQITLCGNLVPTNNTAQ